MSDGKSTESMQRFKRRVDVSIVIPYRNREQHLRIYRNLVGKQLPSSAEIVVVEQADCLPFNRGCLLNIGFQYCEGQRVIFHDVDLIPDKCMLCQYFEPWPGPVVHFASRFSRYNNTKAYFGGVTGFHRAVFPGFPNCFWGWGGEDDVLYRRTRARIHRPSNGSYTDLEFVPTAKQKSKILKKWQKCPNRWELKASDNCATDNHRHIPAEVRLSHRLHEVTEHMKTVQVFFY